MTAIALIGAAAEVAPLYAQAGGASAFPPSDESALVTVVGCLQRGGNHQDEYVLSDVAVGPATGMPEATCRPSSSGAAIELEHDRRVGMNDTMLGRWVEVSGRLEKETSSTPHHLRELHVRSVRMVPVIPPRAAATTAPLEVTPPEQVPLIAGQTAAAEPEPATAPQAPEPVGTSGQAQEALPKTAGELPPVAAIVLLSLAGALALRSYRVRERG
jgi:hypothetical protein